MKLPRFLRGSGLFLAALLHPLLVLVICAQERPEITSIRVDGSNVVIVTRVPAGITRVILESRNRAHSGGWVPQALKRMDGTGGSWTATLPRSAAIEVLRARAESSETFPASFYNGTNEFIGPPGGGLRNLTPGGNTDTTGTQTKSGTVVESDIWKIENDTLYFFNQYRGLQVIDLSNADAPRLKSTLNLPASGEQMYLLGSFAVLLTRDCGSSSLGSGVQIIQTSGEASELVGQLPLEGWIQESRMVGSALYVTTQTYRQLTSPDPKTGTTWEWGSVVASFDLSDPRHPVAKSKLWFPGWGNVISATDRFLLVCVRDPANTWHSTIHIIDISDEQGAMVTRGEIPLKGEVADKFKLNVSQDVLTVVSESWNDRAQWTTLLENYSLAVPSHPSLLGSLVIQVGERLFATRFDGPRAYVVTFRRIDPLFIVDLSNPAHPKLSGQIEIPGWSTYLHPLGDRLLTIGIDNAQGWRVAVSLFDVQNSAAPKLLSRVPIGENYSWSEANSDEKAFGIVEEAGLLLVPYQGYTTNGYASRVQLIDLNRDNLVARGTIDHTMTPRRASLYNNRILSLSGRELITLDPVDRDHPKILNVLPLAWRVDRIKVAGRFLVEFTSSGWDTAQSRIRVTSLSDPDHILVEEPVSNWPFLGVTSDDHQLYVLQGSFDGTVFIGNGEPAPTSKDLNLSLTLFDLDSLPALKKVGQVFKSTQPLGWGANWKPLWVKPGLLVWTSAGGGFFPWGMLDGPRAMGAAIDALWRPWYGGQGGRLLAFDISKPDQPRLASDFDLFSDNRWSFSEGITSGGRVYLSHQTTEFLEGVVPPGWVKPGPTIVQDPKTGILTTNEAPIGTWVQKDLLDVIDYEDPTAPVARKAISLPGRLIGLSHGGEMLYTLGPTFDVKTWSSDWNDQLSAITYDGLAAHLVDTLPLPQAWPHPSVALDRYIILGTPSTITGGQHALETWTLSSKGKWIRVNSTSLPSPAQTLTSIGQGPLLAVQGATEVSLFDASTPADLKLRAQKPQTGCLWFDLTTADGSLSTGVWAPAGDFGVLPFLIPSP